MQIGFIQHFMGCQICNALNRNGDLEQCQNGMSHSFDYLQRKHQNELSQLEGRSEAHLTQLRELPYCSAHPAIPECKGAKPLDQAMLDKAVVVSSSWLTVL